MTKLTLIEEIRRMIKKTGDKPPPEDKDVKRSPPEDRDAERQRSEDFEKFYHKSNEDSSRFIKGLNAVKPLEPGFTRTSEKEYRNMLVDGYMEAIELQREFEKWKKSKGKKGKDDTGGHSL